MWTPEIRKSDEELVCGEGRKRKQSGIDNRQARSILKPPPPPRPPPRTMPGLLDMGRSWGRNRVPDSKIWGYFNILTTSTNTSVSVLWCQHSGFEGLVEMAPAPWKGCPSKRVHGTA